MNINELNKENLVDFAKTQKKPLFLVGVIVLSLIITILTPSGKKTGSSDNTPNSKFNNNANSKSANGNGSDKKSFNLFGLLSNSGQNNKIPAPTAPPTNLKGQNIPAGNPTAIIPLTITKVLANGTKITQSLSGSSDTKTDQGTINPAGDIKLGVDSNTKIDKIAMIFKNPDGSTTTYIPPGTPPDEVRWGRYTNDRSKYAINYPVNWQFVYSIDEKGYEGVTLFPPSYNTTDPDSPYIAFSFSESAFNPAGTNLSEAYKTDIIVDGQAGKLYTNGPLGNSYITSVVDYNKGTLGLGASKTDATFAYVYYYMINSLTFNFE